MSVHAFFLKLVLGALWVSLAGTSLWADDAKVLPEGRFRIQAWSLWSISNSRFNESGQSESLGQGFSQKLTPQFLSQLQPSQAGALKQMSQANFGLNETSPIAELKTQVESQIFTQVFAIEYGLTDRVSVGVILPVVYGQVKVKASSESSEDFQQLKAALPLQHPAAPVLDALEEQTQVQGINRVLSQDLGYRDGLRSWSGMGLGDLEVGLKYNYWRSTLWQASIKTGFRIPTGRTDEPDQLFDLGFGDGQFDWAAFHYLDWKLRPDFYLTYEAGYTVQLPHSRIYRVPFSEDLLIGVENQKLQHKPGDYWEMGLEGNWAFHEQWQISGKYRFYQKFRDEFSGAENADLLEENTDRLSHEATASLNFSTLPLVIKKRARVPFDLGVFYTHRFLGKNTVIHHTGGLKLKSYF